MPKELDGIDAIVDKILKAPSCNNAMEIAEKQDRYQRLVAQHAQEREDHHRSGGYSWDWSGRWADRLEEAEKDYRRTVARNTIETLRCILSDPEMVAAIKGLD